MRYVGSIVVVLTGLFATVATGQQTGPRPASLEDLLNGKWSKYAGQTTPATEGAIATGQLETKSKTVKENVAERERAKKYTDKGLGWVNKAVSGIQNASEFGDAWGALTQQDKALEPNYEPPGMPQVPARCAKSQECASCFQTADEELMRIRIAFEKLRRVNTTTKAFISKSLSFGDNVAGIHGVAGLAWQAERRGIEAAAKDFETKYSMKHAELVQGLETALRSLAACEKKYFNEPDWYERYGFMYTTFMADLYRQ